MHVKTLCSGASLWFALVSSAFAEQPAEQWLKRLQTAQATQSYQGAFVYERKGAFTTHQVWRQVNSKGEMLERFVQLNGPEHEVMRVDGQVVCMSSTVAGALDVVDIWPAETFNMQHLQEWYEVIVLGESRVAGHMATVLLFSPRDQHRYPVEIYVDQASDIPLKTLLLNEQGQLLERLQFVQFQAGVDSQAAGAQLKASAECQPVTQTQNNIDTDEIDVDWAVGWTPPGFLLLKSHYKKSADSGNYVLSQVYSDGLASFSVFFEDIGTLEVESGRRQLGPTAVASRKVVRDTERLMVTVVGEIPLGTAERIALSMHTGQEQSND